MVQSTLRFPVDVEDSWPCEEPAWTSADVEFSYLLHTFRMTGFSAGRRNSVLEKVLFCRLVRITHHNTR